MNRTTRFFNGTKGGADYQARVTRYVSTESKDENGHFEIEVVIFKRSTGEPIDSYDRRSHETHKSMRDAVKAVMANPDAF